MPYLMKAAPPAERSVLVLPGNWVQLDEEAIDHLGAGTGDWIQWRQLDHGTVGLVEPTWYKYEDSLLGESNLGGESDDTE